MRNQELYTSEFWVAVAAVALIAVMTAVVSEESEAAGLSGIALIASSYVGGRSLSKAAAAWRGPANLSSGTRRVVEGE